MIETTGSASIEIDASPDAVYAVLSDLSRISELSPECYKAEWEDGATGPEVGAKFRGYNRNGAMAWDAGCVLVTANPDFDNAVEALRTIAPGRRSRIRKNISRSS